MSNRALIDAFINWRATGEPLALATVICTAGSTYSKAGRQILIRASGEHAGLVSGGCLEGDLAEHARRIIAGGPATVITYDMREEADDLWGIGLGCNGMLQILLQRLSADNDWQPFTTLAAAMSGPEPVTAALVTSSSVAELPPGSCIVHRGESQGATAAPSLAVPAALPALITEDHEGERCEILYWTIRPWPRVLLLGGGPDAVPVIEILQTLGWETTVADHRPQYLDSGRLSGADQTVLVQPARLAEQLDLAGYNVVVVMSHHLETDRCYLQHLAQHAHAYVGLLGPAARRTKLLNELGLADSDFGRRLRGPVGLAIGADTPETIALALVGEIQSVLHRVG